MYNNYGKNTQKVIVLVIDVLPEDSATIVSGYIGGSGYMPVFPLILFSSGGKALRDLFTRPGLGGVTWVVSPDRTYIQAMYDDTATINKVLASVSIHTDKSNQGHQKKIQCTVRQNNILITTNEKPAHVSIVALDGQTIQSFQLPANATRRGYDLQTGIYIVKVAEEGGGLIQRVLVRN